jgi:hypothetical protein
MYSLRQAHLPHASLDLASKRAVANQQEMGVRPTPQNYTSSVKNKSLILGMVETSDVSYDRRANWDSELSASHISIKGLLEWAQVQTVVERLKTFITLPAFAKQFRSSGFGGCQSVRRVAIDARFHHYSVETAS